MALLPFQVDSLVKTALWEDLAAGDITTDLLSTLTNLPVKAQLRTRQACVVSGLELAVAVFASVSTSIQVNQLVQNGDEVEAGTCLLILDGSANHLLKAERTALNFLQHACGVATRTRQFIRAVEGTNAAVTDTRKTTPGLRLLEKNAVIHGGGRPHRYHLGSAVMLKDNHIQAAGGILAAVQQIRQGVSHTVKIEVEVDTLTQMAEALQAKADIILLDNFSIDTLAQAVQTIGSRAITEASGGITLENIRAVAETGVQFISTSQITMGANPIDLGLDFEAF